MAGGARNTSALEKLKLELITDNFLHPFNITQPEEVDKFANLTKDRLGIPDLLVNNAGLINKNAPLTQVQPDEFASVLAVNLCGIHNMIRSFVPMMQKAGRDRKSVV